MKSINLKFLLVFLVSVAMVFTLSACGGGASGEGEDASAEGGDVVAEFPFNNVGSEEICELYLSPSGQEDWGPDQLEGNTIPAGESFTLNNIPAGSYDAKAVGCDGGEAIGQLEIANQ